MRMGVCFGLAVLAMGATAAEPAAPEAAPPVTPRPAASLETVGTPVPAVWKEQHVRFLYTGRTARFSCVGLRDKVRAILLELGARRDLKIVPVGCAIYGGARDSSAGPGLEITFSVPVLPDSAMKPLHPGDLAATDARFETFTLTGDAFRNLGIGDCELVQEFSQQILPKLVTRDLRNDVTCVPYQPSRSHFFIKGAVLKPLPRAEQAAGQGDARVP